jgi:hypothetical protein
MKKCLEDIFSSLFPAAKMMASAKPSLCTPQAFRFSFGILDKKGYCRNCQTL